jgi:hypothetical protein
VSDYDSGHVVGDVTITADQSAAGLEVDALAGGAISGVLDNVQTTIATYTAPSKKLISHISVSGSLYAKYQLYKNTSLIETRRGGPDRSMVFEFCRPLKLLANDILDIKVTHFDTVYGG